MKCTKCKKKNFQINFPHLGKLCNDCFTHIIEKRIRKYTRVNCLFSKNDKILVTDKLNQYIIKKILKGLPITIFYRSKIDILYIKKNKINKIVTSLTVDDIACSFIEKILLNKKNKKNNYINLLSQITDEEIIRYAKIKKIKFIPNKKNKDIKKLIDEMDKKYPETKFSLLKSINSI